MADAQPFTAPFCKALVGIRNEFKKENSPNCTLRVAIGRGKVEHPPDASLGIGMFDSPFQVALPGKGRIDSEIRERLSMGHAGLTSGRFRASATSDGWMLSVYSEQLAHLLEMRSDPKEIESVRIEQWQRYHRFTDIADRASETLAHDWASLASVMPDSFNRLTDGSWVPDSFNAYRPDGSRITSSGKLWLLIVYHLAWEQYPNTELNATRLAPATPSDSNGKPHIFPWHHCPAVDETAKQFFSLMPIDPFSASVEAASLLLQAAQESRDPRREPLTGMFLSSVGQSTKNDNDDSEATSEDDSGNGPVPPDALQWKGELYSDCPPTAWRLLDTVWPADASQKCFVSPLEMDPIRGMAMVLDLLTRLRDERKHNDGPTVESSHSLGNDNEMPGDGKSEKSPHQVKDGRTVVERNVAVRKYLASNGGGDAKVTVREVARELGSSDSSVFRSEAWKAYNNEWEDRHGKCRTRDGNGRRPTVAQCDVEDLIREQEQDESSDRVKRYDRI